MKSRFTWKNLIWMSAIVVSAAGLMSVGAPQVVQSQEKQVREAVAQFYVSLNQMFTGDLTAMKDSWSHAEDVVFMGPDGKFLVGWERTLADFQKEAAMKMGGNVKATDIHVVLGQDLAVVQNYEKGDNPNVNVKNQVVSIRATNVFRLEKGVWKMIAHHTDPMVLMEK